MKGRCTWRIVDGVSHQTLIIHLDGACLGQLTAATPDVDWLLAIAKTLSENGGTERQ